MKIRSHLKFFFRKLALHPFLYELLAYFFNFFYSLIISKKVTAIHKRNEVRLLNNQSKSVLIMMHWLSVGGAEKFAVDCINYYQTRGYSVHLFVERESDVFYSSGISKADKKIYYYDSEINDAFNYIGKEILKGSYKIIHNHHTDVFYNLFHSNYCPSSFYIDTLHILELPIKYYGYPRKSLQYTNYIDIHHVISEELSSYLKDSGVNPEKIIYGNLNFNSLADTFKPEKLLKKKEIVFGFLGRMERQKRPLLFLYLAKQINLYLHHFGIRSKYILMGEGYYLKNLNLLVGRYQMSDKVIFYPKDYDINKFFNQIDLLLLTSENEGLALVTLEALSRNKIVVSTDVGSQKEIVSNHLLIRSNPLYILKDIKSILSKMILEDSAEFYAGIQNQELLIKKFIKKENAWLALDRVLKARNIIN